MRFPLFALLAGNSLLVLGGGLQALLLPVRAHMDGFSDQSVGLLGSGYYLGFVLGCLVAPRLLRRVGHTRSFAVLAVVAGQSFLLYTASPMVTAWVALRVIAGFCFAGLSMVVESWVNETSLNAERGRNLATYLTVSSCASVGGQSLLRLTDPLGMTGFLIVCLCISLSLIPLALSVAPGPRPIARVRLDICRLYRTSPVGLVGCLGVGLANGSFWSLAPLFLQARGRTPDQVTLIMCAAVVGGALLQWPVGRLSDRIDRRLVMLAACAAALLAGVLLAMLSPFSWRGELALAAIFGATAFPLYALCVAHANDHAAPGSFVEISGGLLLTFGIGAAIGPLFASLLMAKFSTGLFLFTAGVHAALGLVLAWRMRRRSAVPAGIRRPFIGLTGNTPAAPRLGGFIEFPEPSLAAGPVEPDHSQPRWAAR